MRKAELIDLINSENEVNNLETEVKELKLEEKSSCKYTISNVSVNGEYFNYTLESSDPNEHRIIFRDVYRNLEKNVVPMLKNLCKFLCIKGYSTLKKAELINLIKSTSFYDEIKY